MSQSFSSATLPEILLKVSEEHCLKEELKQLVSDMAQYKLKKDYYKVWLMHSYSRNIKEYIYGAGNEQDRFTYLPNSLIPILKII